MKNNGARFRFSAVTFSSLLISGLLWTTWAKASAPTSSKPTHLSCEALIEPLGIDTPKPSLSWQLQDQRWGAKQTAYEILVSSKPGSAVRADVWDSGRIASEQSVGVSYGGPALAAETRYFWRVRVWGKDGEAYPVSDSSWWETGLLNAEGWQAKWIGYEGSDLRALRTSGATWITNPARPKAAGQGDTRHDFRLHFQVATAVKQAVLYTAGEDTVAAWVNGAEVQQTEPLPPWKHLPWKTYASKDVTSHLNTGENEISIGVTHYNTRDGGASEVAQQVPMSMVLLLQMKDGSLQMITSKSNDWKAELNAREGWHAPSFDDTSWRKAEPYKAEREPGQSADGDPGDPVPTGPVVLLRHSFEETKPIASARLYATALGAYKFHLNGKAVGDQILAPGWMDFREHVAYQVYDVTAMLRPGKNAIASYLAPGWYSTPLMWFRQSNNYGRTPPALKAQLRIAHTDGTVEWISTDDSWKADVSPIVSAEIYDGESYDARLLQPGWDGPAFLDAKWHSAAVISPQEPKIIAQTFQPIREEKVLSAKAITSPSPGVYVYDFGQNLTGVPRLHLRGGRGEDVKLRFAEVLNADGSVYVENLRTAKATDHFVLAGKAGGEDFQPQFTFHGFRYLEVSGLSAKPSLDAVKTVVIHTDAPFTTRFSSGDAMINQLWSNIQWGQRSNFIGVPTDCPQRDERLGWSADAQVFWRTAAYNMDLNSFTRKYSADLRGTQVGTSMYGIFAPGTNSRNPGFGAAWSDAGVIIPWTGWLQTGNKQVIEENWEAMERYLAGILQLNPDFLWRKGFGAAFGDWLTPTQATPEDLLATAYWAYDITLMQQMAVASGRTEAAEKYSALFREIKTAFNKAYVRSDGSVGALDTYPSIPPPTIATSGADKNKEELRVETQTGYVLALYMKLLPEEMRPAASQRLVKKIKDNHWLLGTGFLGTPYLLGVLSDTGHSDVAYRLLLNKEYPSWGYLIEHGATTTWERWNGDQMRNDPSMNSYNHYAYGAVAEWIYRYAAGVDTPASDPGFHTVLLHPNFDSRLGSLDFSYDSPYGVVSSKWTMKTSPAVWKVTLPPNTTGLLDIHAMNASRLTLDGVALTESKKIHADGEGSYRLPAGTYSFVVNVNPSSSESSTSSR